jgi:hypothetical protein
MDLKIQKTVVSFPHKTNSRPVRFDYNIGGVLSLRIDCVKDPGISLHSKPYLLIIMLLYNFWALMLLGLFHLIANKSSFNSRKLLYVDLIRSKLMCASIAWNNFTLAEFSELKNAQKEPAIV